ncbi:conserved hypothetical protein [Mucor ambiguus]|uniref:RING-type domain-containing protein n=1 Tax=Mucor ambiguus TaxID=91626 RepID=A0A0C9N3A0_9FUNG|nr:conserved hypothetical protein [Mucor ambiguus]
MPFQCIICLQPLITSGDHPAVIPCGHVYHRGCLQPWVREHRNCPLCKKACTQQKIISPLYLSSDNEQTQTYHADASEETQVLQIQLLHLRQEKETVQQRYNITKQELLDEKVKSQEMASDLRGATKAIRHMKQIRRVAELNDLMDSPTSRAFFENLDSYSKEDLLIQNRAMQSRLRKAHTERDDAVRKSSLLERSNLHLEKKIERLQNKLQLAENGSAIIKQVATALPKPKRTGNVIVLDDSDEDNDRDDSNDDDQTLDDDSDSPVLIAESSSNHNTIYNSRDDHSSSRQTLKRHHSLLSDNEDDFAIEEHKRVYVFQVLKHDGSFDLPF